MAVEAARRDVVPPRHEAVSMSLVSPEVASKKHTRVAFHSCCVTLASVLSRNLNQSRQKKPRRCGKTEPACRVRAIISRSGAQDDTLLSVSSLHVLPCSATIVKVIVVLPLDVILSLCSSVSPLALLRGLSKGECDRWLSQASCLHVIRIASVPSRQEESGKSG